MKQCVFERVRSLCVPSHGCGGILTDVSFFSEEDRYDSYSRMVLKYFLAEGVVCRHELFVSTAQESPDDILQV